MPQCFQFQLNELFKLYFAIFEIVKYFALNNTVLEKKLILSKFEQKESTYQHAFGTISCT